MSEPEKPASNDMELKNKTVFSDVLTAKREAVGINVDQIAKTLNLMPSRITALETFDLDALPSRVYIKGYLRSYAGLIDADPQALTDEYLSHFDALERQKVSDDPIDVETRQRDQKKAKASASNHNRHYWLLISGLAMLCLAVIAGVVVMTDRPNPNADSVASNFMPPKPLTIDTAQGTVVVDDINELSSEQPTASLMTQASPELSKLPRAPDTLIDVALNGQNTNTDSGGELLIASDDNLSLLVFEFSDRCWVQVHDATNTLIYKGVKRARQRLQLTGVAPFKVILGYAEGVSISYNGEAVTITPKPRTKRAELVIGN